MKKIVRQQNYLRELVNSQENRIITKQALRCAVRAILEPLLDNIESGVVLYRIINNAGLSGLIKRLEFSEIESYDFSDTSDNLREKVWADTEFMCVMTHRFVAILIWDNKTENKNYVRYYSIWNSKLQDEALDIINRNSIIDIKKFQERFHPDRRDNELMNSSIRRLLENMDEATKDAVLGYAEYQSKPQQYSGDIREIAHEIKNQLSICDLYSEILSKYCEKNQINDETIINSITSISKAIKLTGNMLLSFKASRPKNLNTCDVKKIIDEVKNLTKVYFECKNIEYIVESKANLKILADEDAMVAVLVNLIKNSIEAFEEKEDKEYKNGKYVKLKTEKHGEHVFIRIINNAGEINEPERIFEKGFTTKQGGSGLGLNICYKSIAEQSGQLKLEHTGEDYTEFSIKMKLWT